jgi:opacity protein-like surface antigen
MELGFQSGVNLSSPYGDNISKEQTGILAGLHIGGHVKINITSHFGVKAILAYDQIGASYSPLMLENSTGTGIVKGKLVSKLNYLNLPLLAEYSFGNKVKFNVNAGAFAGLLLKYTLITKTEEPGVSANRTSPDTRKSTNFGASAGAGIQLPITSSMKLDLGIQDNLGLSNTYNDGGTTKINSIAFTGGLTFVIK